MPDAASKILKGLMAARDHQLAKQLDLESILNMPDIWTLQDDRSAEPEPFLPYGSGSEPCPDLPFLMLPELRRLRLPAVSVLNAIMPCWPAFLKISMVVSLHVVSFSPDVQALPGSVKSILAHSGH